MKIYISLVIAVLCIFYSISFAQEYRCYILCYHTFKNKVSFIDFTQEELREQLLFLKDNGFKFISLKDFIEGRVSSKSILITIDDGNNSVYDAYYKVFKPLKIKPVLAIITGYIGKKWWTLNWQQVYDLYKSGCTIVSHGLYHRKLDKWTLDSKIEEELKYSKRYIQHISSFTDIYVYPFGSYVDKVFPILEKEKYQYALTINSGYVVLPLSKNKKFYVLPRYMLTRQNYKKILREISQ